MDDEFKMIVVASLVLSIGLMAVSFGVHAHLDRYRISTIEQSLETHQFDTIAVAMREEFASMHGIDSCELRTSMLFELREHVRELGGELTRYGRTSRYQDRVDYLTRSYILAQLELYALVERTNELCDTTITPVIFFYRIDHRTSDRQGLALEEAMRERDDAIAFAFDIDYPDEPLLGFFKTYYSVTNPTIVIKDDPYALTLSQQEITRLLDFYRDEYSGVRADYTYVIRAAGIDETMLEETLLSDTNESLRARADAIVTASRITGEDVCAASYLYESAGDPLSILTLASLRCTPDYRERYEDISASFAPPLSQVLETLARDEPLELVFEPYEPTMSFEPPEEFSSIRIGDAGITITDQIITTQADRVTRDWLSGQLNGHPLNGSFLRVFSERFTYAEEDLREDIGWHEGARISYIDEYSNATIGIGTTTLVARDGDRWYAPDEQGIFRFEVPLDKVLYPSNIFLTEDLVLIEDTHGLNMIVAQAIAQNASIVLGCCDHPGKIHAAQYLSQRNITSICLTDRFIAQALGTPRILGSPPIISEDDGVRVGYQPITIGRHETVIAANATLTPYALWYFTTPTSYFERLPLRVVAVTLDDFDQQERLIDAARDHGSSVIATRVFSRSDAEHLSAWLDEDPDRRAVLFHSVSYPYGFELLGGYPNQVSFGDSDPVFI
jgi:hypothetical protein